MIFVCLGTKRFEFNRLLKEIDRLIDEGIIKERVVAQVGHSTYTSKNIESYKFFDAEKYKQTLEESDVVITHGGTGAIVSALKQRKYVLAVPRKFEYGEHSDDHQLEIVSMFDNLNMIIPVYDVSELELAYNTLSEKPNLVTFEGNGNVLNIITDFIERN